MTYLPETAIPKEISVKFNSADIGQYEMPIMFTFHKRSNKKNIIFIREMVSKMFQYIDRVELYQLSLLIFNQHQS